jgi:hypothetical protein
MRLFRDQDYTIRFLKGLNEEYAYVRSQIMMMDPFPPIAKAFSLVIQQERQLHAALGTDIDDNVKLLPATNVQPLAANNVHSFNRGQGQDNRRGGYNNRGRGRYNGGGRGQGGNRLCTHYGQRNHTIDTCYMLHGFPPGYQTKSGPKTGSSAHVTFNGNGIVGNHSSEPATNNVSLTHEQYNGLMDLLQQSKL